MPSYFSKLNHKIFCKNIKPNIRYCYLKKSCGAYKELHALRMHLNQAHASFKRQLKALNAKTIRALPKSHQHPNTPSFLKVIKTLDQDEKIPTHSARSSTFLY